jgi:DNA polymerase
MSAESLLKAWVAQQRELGDRELVLPTLTAEQAANAIVAGQRSEGKAKTASTDGGDWRTALESAGAAPARGKRGRTLPPVPNTPEAVAVEAVDGWRNEVTFAEALGAAESIEHVAGMIAGCRRCDLYKSARNSVPGEGNPHADFVCVGEAPGATEDETGRPFVGQAGQLLTKILGAINLSRDDVFIVNLLKHRPPGNRNPSPEESMKCRPYLLRQLELLQPRVIVALGTYAAQTLLDTKVSIGKLRGQVHDYQGIPVVVTYHPAALLRNPAWKRPTWEDVQLARRILDGSVA